MLHRCGVYGGGATLYRWTESGVPYPRTVSVILISTREVGYRARNCPESAEDPGKATLFILNQTSGTVILIIVPVPRSVTLLLTPAPYVR